MAARRRGKCFYITCFCVVVAFALLGLTIWVLHKDSSSDDDPMKPVYSVVNATMTNIAHTDNRFTADFSFTLSAQNPNKEKTIDYANATQPTAALYFDREAEEPTLVVNSTTLPVPSPLLPGTSDNRFTFDLHARDALLDRGNSEFFNTGKSGYGTFDDHVYMLLQVNFTVPLDESTSHYDLLMVKCHHMAYSSHGFEVNSPMCKSYFGG